LKIGGEVALKKEIIFTFLGTLNLGDLKLGHFFKSFL
jgi:hypothetical protein